MDPLSITASIITVIEFARHIGTACKSYIEGVKDYPKDLRTVYVEIQTLAVIFESLKFLDQNDPEDASILSHLEGPDGPVERCRAATEALNSLFSSPVSISSPASGSKRRKLQLCLGTLAWPLKVEKARRLMEDINRHKSTINVVIGGSLLRDVHAIKKTLSESQQREVCNWFQHTDPSSNHNAALRLYENGTCDWVLRTMQWKQWLEFQTRCFWIHGIPGAGKTILAAHLIKEVDDFIEKQHQQKLASVYYYCYHGRDQDEAVPILKWLISQLCRQLHGIPEPVYAVFHQGRDPSLEDLLGSLHSILAHFDRVLVTIDALDESESRGNLLNLIKKMVSDHRFDKIQLLATSRLYADINNTMTRISESISMSNKLVEADIKTYVAACMKNDPNFLKWPGSLRDEIEEKLSEGAQGMFRWAVCQLDILRRLHYANKIKDAIRNLPKGLDETYERIFSLILPEDRDLVRHVLHLIAYDIFIGYESARPDLSSSIALESYLMKEKLAQTTMTDSHHLFDIDSLKESCGCLIKVNDDDDINFAHYTVREFLVSERASSLHSFFFQIHDVDTYADMGNLIFNIATNATESDIVAVHPDFDSDSWVLDALGQYCREIGIEALEDHCEIFEPQLILEFFDVSKPNYSLISEFLKEISPSGGYNNLCPDYSVILDSLWEQFDGHQSVGVWIRMACAGFTSSKFAMNIFRSLGQDSCWTDRFFLPTPISKTRAWEKTEIEIVYQFKGNVFELFASFRNHNEGGDPTDDVLGHLLNHVKEDIDYTRILHLQMWNHNHENCDGSIDRCNVNLLLAKGARPQPRSCQVTPLQIAVASRDGHAVQLLLEANADPNSCGDVKNREWDGDVLFGHLCHLSGRSPLFILRQFDALASGYSYARAKNGELEELLLEYGAREFTVLPSEESYFGVVLNV